MDPKRLLADQVGLGERDLVVGEHVPFGGQSASTSGRYCVSILCWTSARPSRWDSLMSLSWPILFSTSMRSATVGSPSAICFICASDSTVSSRSSMVRTGDLFVKTWLMKRCLRSTME